jgi:hypothetical protein
VTADETGRVKDWGKTRIKQRAESRPRKDVRAALLLPNPVSFTGRENRRRALYAALGFCQSARFAGHAGSDRAQAVVEHTAWLTPSPAETRLPSLLSARRGSVCRGATLHWIGDRTGIDLAIEHSDGRRGVRISRCTALQVLSEST